MKIAIVHKVKGQKEPKTVEFTGSASSVKSNEMEYIFNNQPIEVIAVRFTLD